MKNIPVRKIASPTGLQNPAGRFSIRKVQELLKGKDLVHDLHRHDFFFILALEKGSGWHEIDFIPYTVRKDSVFLLRPGQVHKLLLKTGSTGYLMEFDLSFYQPRKSISEQRWRRAIHSSCCYLKSSVAHRMHELLKNIYNEFTTRQDGYEEAVRASLDLFFIEYLRHGSGTGTKEKAENNYAQERFDQLTQLLETNIHAMKNASQYAEALGLSLYQINAITKTSVGKTVSELINAQILLEAKRYLLASSGQVKEIADHLGYEDVSYFIRFFKKHTGYSPEAFRKHFV